MGEIHPLPQQLRTARMDDNTIGRNVDDRVGDLEKAISGIFGVYTDQDTNAGDDMPLPLRLNTLPKRTIAVGATDALNIFGGDATRAASGTHEILATVQIKPLVHSGGTAPVNSEALLHLTGKPSQGVIPYSLIAEEAIAVRSTTPTLSIENSGSDITQLNNALLLLYNNAQDFAGGFGLTPATPASALEIANGLNDGELRLQTTTGSSTDTNLSIVSPGYVRLGDAFTPPGPQRGDMVATRLFSNEVLLNSQGTDGQLAIDTGRLEIRGINNNEVRIVTNAVANLRVDPVGYTRLGNATLPASPARGDLVANNLHVGTVNFNGGSGRLRVTGTRVELENLGTGEVRIETNGLANLQVDETGYTRLGQATLPASPARGDLVAANVYSNGVQLTCYALEYAVNGKMDLAFWDRQAGEATRNETVHDFLASERWRYLDVRAFTDRWRDVLSLPTMPSRKTWKQGSVSLGKLVNHLWETVDFQAVHIGQLLARLEALEAEVDHGCNRHASACTHSDAGRTAGS